MEYRRRNSLRRPGYDYAQSEAVFVTICTHGRQHLFGAIEDGAMVHSPVGLLVTDRWRTIPDRCPGVMIDTSIVMPDHIHGMLFTAADPEAGPATVGEVIRWFKSWVHAGYRDGVRQLGWPPDEPHLWQRNSYDQIIRSEAELVAIGAYIEANPERWRARLEKKLYS